MGNGERNNEPPSDASIDGWFDLLDDDAPQGSATRSPAPAGPPRPSQSPANLSGLNEISNKVTPVMLTPVQQLTPIEPVHPSDQPRDVWETDEEPFDSFFSTPPANGGARKSDPDPLPPLLEMEDAHGEEFLDFGEPQSYSAGDAFATPYSEPRPPASTKPPMAQFSTSALPPEAFPSRPPSMPASAGTPTAPPLTNTLMGQIAAVPAQPSAPPAPEEPAAPAAPEEDSFDLSDFDRWGQDEVTPVPGPAPASPAKPAPAAPTATRSPDPAPSRNPFDLLSGFASPPDNPGFSDALTVPFMLPGGPPKAAMPSQAPPPAPSAASNNATTRPAPPMPSAGPAPIAPNRPAPRTMAWMPEAPPQPPQPEAPRPPPSSFPPPRRVPSNRPRSATASPEPGAPRPPPLPKPPAQTRPRPPAETRPKAPASPAQTRPRPPSPPAPGASVAPPSAPPAPAPRKPTPRQEMHERLDLGDFTGALATAETMLEVDPDDHDATHVAEVCRAKLRAIYIGRLGSLDQVPVLAVPQAQLRWLALDHRAGFILSLVDGMSTLDDIIDISAMPQLEALRTLYNLSTQQIITLRKR